MQLRRVKVLLRYMCMGPPMPEDPFLSSVRLTPWLARSLAKALGLRFGLRVARRKTLPNGIAVTQPNPPSEQV